MAPGRATSIIEKEELKMNRVLRMKRKIKREREREGNIKVIKEKRTEPDMRRR